MKTAKPNQLQLRKTEIDWLNIIKLALDRKGWGNKFVLYTYGTASVTCEIETFNFPQNKAVFKLQGAYNSELDNSWYNEEKIEYFLKNFSVDEFKTLIQKKIKGMLKYILECNLRMTAEDINSDMRTFYSGVSDQMIKKEGFGKDLKQTLFLSEDVKWDTLRIIKEKVLNIVNEKFYHKVKKYIETSMETGKGTDLNLYKLYKSIPNTEEEE